MNERPLEPNEPLLAAIRAIETSRRRIAVVAASDGRVVGTLTDGDVRRCLLTGGSLSTPISRAMNARPIVAEASASVAHLLGLMARGNIMAIPIVDDRGRFVRLVHLTDLAPEHEGARGAAGFPFAVIMAGGEGKRLRPLTETVPKPMLDIGGVPLMERQLERLSRAGVRRVYISVNYLSDVIEQHFGDGAAVGMDITYLREQEKLGTAGALALLPERPSESFLVMNGDILTTVDFGSLCAYHSSHAAWVTVAAIDYRVEVPYGVITADGAAVVGLQEKPSQRFLCNAGVYAVRPDVLDLIAGTSGQRQMTSVIEACLRAKHPVAVFPLHEYWSDIGTVDDLQKARDLFSKAT